MYDKINTIQGTLRGRRTALGRSEYLLSARMNYEPRAIMFMHSGCFDLTGSMMSTWVNITLLDHSAEDAHPKLTL